MHISHTPVARGVYSRSLATQRPTYRLIRGHGELLRARVVAFHLDAQSDLKFRVSLPNMPSPLAARSAPSSFSIALAAPRISAANPSSPELVLAAALRCRTSAPVLNRSARV